MGPLWGSMVNMEVLPKEFPSRNFQGKNLYQWESDVALSGDVSFSFDNNSVVSVNGNGNVR